MSTTAQTRQLRRPRPDITSSPGPDPYGNPDPEWLKINWREHLKTIVVPSADPAAPGREAEEAGGTLVNYVEMGPPEGDADPCALVFVHGLSGCWQNWLENIPHFARRHRVLALDLPGFGSSPVPDWEITIPNYGRLLNDFCDAVGADDCAVIGNSMGGFVSAEAAIAEPEQFEKLVLVSAAGISSARLRERPTAVVARMMGAAAPLLFSAQTRAFRRPGARAKAFRGIFDNPGALRPELIWEFFQGGVRAESFVEAMSTLVAYDFLDRLSEIEVPTLIVWGRQDHVVPPADALGYAQRISHARLEVFDRCGHVPMAERPQRFNALLEEFLAAPSR